MSDPRVQRFAFAFAPAYRLAGLPFGILPGTTGATLSPEELDVRFGPWRARSRVDNVAEVTLTGPYALLKTAGPARLAITDRGLTFATNGERGVRIRFREPIGAIEPTGILRHPELTLTLADGDGFARRLEALARRERRSSRGW